MPLDFDEADLVGRPLHYGVLSFFKRNRSVAYSSQEILLELGFLGVYTTIEVLQVELDALVRRERLVEIDRDGDVYYRYDNRLGLRPPR